jgi:hypothetical protein
VLTNNPASQTTALLETTLPAGVYTLHVRNTGAGDPLSATPTGYTAYGSLGQYFISGWVTAPDTPVVPPTASLQVADLLEPGQASLALAVTYSDDVAVAVATVDARDIRVTGPNGYDRTARWIALDLPTDGSPRTATYAVDPPDGAAWSPAHNGTYTVTLLEHAVEDTRGNRCDAAMLGTFSVTIAPPAGLLEVTPADDLKASGTVGGPFSPSSIVYTLTNPGGSTLDWTASNPQGWVSLSATGGTLAAGASTTVTVAFNDYTGTLGVDSYAQTVSFLNTTTGQGDTTRTVDLTVEPALDRLHFSLCSLSEPGVFQMVIWATPGTEVVLESSTNLLEWWAVSTNQVAPDGTVTFAVPTDGSTPAQGYRARQGP